MSSEKNSKILLKIVELLSNFGETLLNLENQLYELNKNLNRIEQKIDKLGSSELDLDLSLEKECVRLEKSLNDSVFTPEELNELKLMEKEFISEIPEGELEELDIDEIDLIDDSKSKKKTKKSKSKKALKNQK